MPKNIINQLILYHRTSELIKIFGRIPPTILDLGCGDGQFLKLFHQKGSRVVGVDLVASPHSFTHQEDINHFSSKEKFDVVSLYHVAEHLHTPTQIFSKALSWLSPGGLLIVEVPVTDGLTHRFLKNDYFIYFDPNHQQFLSTSKWQQLLNQSGFDVIKKTRPPLQFPLTLISSSFKKNSLKGFLSLFLFLPLKLLTLIGHNDEIVRFYSRPR